MRYLSNLPPGVTDYDIEYAAGKPYPASDYQKLLDQATCEPYEIEQALIAET